MQAPRTRAEARPASPDGASPREPASPGGCDAWRLVAADVTGVPAGLLDEVERLQLALETGLGESAEGMRWLSHRFTPRGVSVVGTAARVRIVLHTWPETSRATLDLYAVSAHPEGVLRRCIDELLSGGDREG
jgi:S-adenosylmethionine/arginine decarboxylase-like enzyme